MSSTLPHCITADARPLTCYEFATLMLDEIEQMAQEGDALDHAGMPSEAGLYFGWWSSLTEAQKERWRNWLVRNLEVDETQTGQRRRP